MKYTKGPWKFSEPDIVSSLGEDVCSLNYGELSESDLANAALIAAAPEMLEALEKAVQWLSAHNCAEEFAVLEKVNAAIKKARGES